MPVILSDIDDTLMSCAAALQSFLAEEHGMETDLSLRDHHNIPMLFGIDVDRTLELVAEFQRSKRMLTMEPEPCAKVVLPELHKQGYRFVAISACLNEPETVEMRRRNLEEAFGFAFEEVHCIGLVRCKRAALSQYEPAIWVDDLFHHAESGTEFGHRSFVIDRPHNQHSEHPQVKRVANWHEIAAELG